MRSHSETADFSACRLDFIETDAPVLSVFGSSAIAPHRVSHFPAGRGADEAAPLEPAVLVHNPARLARQRDTGLEDKRLLR